MDINAYVGSDEDDADFAFNNGEYDNEVDENGD